MKTTLLACTLLLSVVAPLSAAPIPITNGDFSNPDLTNGSSTAIGSVTGWNATRADILNPAGLGLFSPLLVPPGVQVARLYSSTLIPSNPDGEISQVLSENMEIGLYELQATMLSDTTLGALDIISYEVELYAGGVLQASQSGTLSLLDIADNVSLFFEATALNPNLGDPLSVRFVNTDGGLLASPVYVSDVSLTLVPEPATAGLLAIGGLALMLRRRRQG